VISGGETTVRVRGGGRGGRNQEFALALAPLLRGCDCAVLSAGTDGIDGPTDAAGAFVTGSTAERAAASGLDPDRFLAANDSYTFFAALGDLHRCGATGTNLMDIKIAAGPGAPPRATRAGDSALLRS
jgi:hydroxypyruvate reductase